MESVFPTSREEALRRSELFCAQSVVHYASDRNYVKKKHSNVSRLSACIGCRLISESEVIQHALQNHPFTRVEKFVQEVHWRTYWKGWLEHHPQVWQSYKFSKQKVKTTLDNDSFKKWQAILHGESGNSLVDAWIQELVTTGYLHNHVRMWFASYWIHGCRLPWQLGAEFFEDYLIDADAACNTLSWRWVAGLQTKGKTYLIRSANVEKYDWRALLPEHKRALEEFRNICSHLQSDVETTAVNPSALPVQETTQGPEEVACIWIHEENTGFVSDLFRRCNPQLVILSLWSEQENNHVRQKWRNAVLQDTLKRAQQMWKCEILLWKRHKEEQRIIQELVKRGITRVDCVRAAIGYLRDYLLEFSARLNEFCIQLVEHLDSWDAQFWPLTTTGFFPYWANVKKRYLMNVECG